jgi:hypothetical protein
MSKARFEKLQRLLPAEVRRVANIIEGNIAQSDNYLKERLPIINCECGAEILVIPDLQAMDRAIKTHVAKHRKKKRNIQKNEISPSKVSEVLSQLTIIKMSEHNNT